MAKTKNMKKIFSRSRWRSSLPTDSEISLYSHRYDQVDTGAHTDPDNNNANY